MGAVLAEMAGVLVGEAWVVGAAWAVEEAGAVALVELAAFLVASLLISMAGPLDRMVPVLSPVILLGGHWPLPVGRVLLVEGAATGDGIVEQSC